MPKRRSWFAEIIASMLGNKPGKAGNTRKTASVNSLSEESEDKTSDTKEC